MSKILNVPAALEMVGGETELLKMLLDAFVHDKPFAEIRLQELIQEPDAAAAAKYVHYFKGAARQIGGEALGETGQALEDVLRGKAEGNLRVLTEAFVIAYNQTLEAAKRTLETL